MWSSVIAVIGTLAGASLAFAFQMHLARNVRRDALEDRVHLERRDACAALCAAMVAYRHGQIARRSHKNKTGADDEAVAHEVRRARGDAWAAFFRLELVGEDAEVRLAAERCMEGIRQLKYADDPAVLESEGEQTRREIHALMRLSRERLLDPV